MLEFLITLGGISLAMSVVILLMLALRKPIKKRFAALGRYIIWSVIIIRLCLPVSLDILPKLITLPTAVPEQETVHYEVGAPTVTPETVYTPEAAVPTIPSSEVINEPVPENTAHETYIPPVSTPEKPDYEITGEHILTALFTVWAVGALVFIISVLVRYRVNVKRLDSELSLPDPETFDIYDSVCRELGIKKAPALYMGRADVSPMVYGFIRAKVVLPRVEMPSQSMTYILRHELTHYKRGDLWFKLLSMLANALHWFNPFVYIACGMMSSEAELSCDEATLSKTDLIGRLGYGNSMLEIVKLCKHSPKLTTGFSPKKKAVKERFENMINTTKKKKGYWIVAITLISALLCTNIIGCTTKETEPKDTDETDEPVTEEYEAAGWIENIEGEALHDWYLRIENDVMVLEHSAEDGSTYLCYRYGDSSKYDDVIELSPILKVTEENRYSHNLRGWISADYALIEYDAPIESIEDCKNIYFVTIDLRDGSVTNKIGYEVDEILSMHGLEREVLSVYESWGGNPPEYSIGCDVSRYEMFGEPPSNKLCMYYHLINKDQRGAMFCVYFDMVTGELSEIEKGHCNLEKYTSGDVITDIADISVIEDLEPSVADAAEAFLSGDTTTLEELGKYEPGLLKDLESISFGDYRISRIHKNTLKINAMITSGGSAFNIDKGLHSFTVDYTEHELLYTRVTHECVGCLVPITDNYNVDAELMAEGWISFSNAPVVPMGDAYTDDYYIDVVRYLHYIYESNTVSEYRDHAKKCFGIDILTDEYTDKEAEEKEAELLSIYFDDSYNKQNYVLHNLVDAGEDYVTMQFYADTGYMVPAYKVRYEFSDDGEYLYFKDCTVLDDTGRDAYGEIGTYLETIEFEESITD